jgi:hypothetical protein
MQSRSNGNEAWEPFSHLVNGSRAVARRLRCFFRRGRLVARHQMTLKEAQQKQACALRHVKPATFGVQTLERRATSKPARYVARKPMSLERRARTRTVRNVADGKYRDRDTLPFKEAERLTGRREGIHPQTMVTCGVRTLGGHGQKMVPPQAAERAPSRIVLNMHKFAFEMFSSKMEPDATAWQKIPRFLGRAARARAASRCRAAVQG